MMILSKFGGENTSAIVATILIIKIGTPMMNKLNVEISIEKIPKSDSNLFISKFLNFKIAR